MKINKEKIILFLKFFLPVSVMFFLLLYHLSDVAGLHRDEAAFGLFAEAIQNGLRPLHGLFNFYTAPMHSYLIAWTFSFFGESIWSLRISGVILNIFAVWFYFDILRRYFYPQAFTTLWLLLTSPFFVILSRIAGENYALNPFFFFGGIWFFCASDFTRQKFLSWTSCVISGLFFFLGIWNHIVFLPSALSICITCLIFARTNIKIILQKIPWFALGVFIGSIPKLYGVIFLHDPFFSAEPPSRISSLSTAFLNMLYTLGGDALFNRACGRTILSFNWFLPALVLLSSCIIFSKKEIFRKKIWLFVFFCIVLNFLGIWLMTPCALIGSRLFLLPLWMTPLLLTSGFSFFKKKIHYSLITMIVIINLCSIGTNYFYAFFKTKGMPVENVYVGGRYDNSWDFIDMRHLADKIICYNPKHIFIEDYNTFRLAFLLPKSLRSRIHTIEDFYREEGYFNDSLFIFYRRKNDGQSFSVTIDGEEIFFKYQPHLSSGQHIVFTARHNRPK